jgi:hypothetical protein
MACIAGDHADRPDVAMIAVRGIGIQVWSIRIVGNDILSHPVGIAETGYNTTVYNSNHTVDRAAAHRL